ncbi:MAG: Nif3-like dinuclear metal center hexameric protein [Gemmatimonadaceae bacterium]
MRGPARIYEAVSMLVIGAASAFPLSAQTVTAAEITGRIIEKSGVAVPNPTVDTFKAGDPKTPVRRIAVTMMATLDVLKRAATNGDNFVITHEPTFYSHRDTLGVLESENDAVLAAKKKFIAGHGLVIWRFHDIPHRMKPDIIMHGVVHSLGWENNQRDSSGQLFDLVPTTLGQLAEAVSKRLGANSTRIIGDANARVSKVGLTEGFPGFPANRHLVQGHSLDVLVMGEDHEWETIEYAKDAIDAGQLKGVIVVGHIASEQAGMEEVARWLRSFIAEVPVDFVPTREPFKALR